MSGDKWYQEVVDETLEGDGDEVVEHEAPLVQAIEPSDADIVVEEEPDYEVVSGSRVYPGIVKRTYPGRKIIDQDGNCRRMVD